MGFSKVPVFLCFPVHVVRFRVVRAEECFYMAPRALDGVVMSARTPINEASVVIDGAMRVTLRVEIPVRRPAITDDCSPGSCMYNGHLMAVIHAAVLSGVGMRKGLPDSSSTPPKTR